MSPEELELLRASALNVGGDGRVLCVTVNGCAYSCCGRPWQRRDGYWQDYRGWIDNLHIDDDLTIAEVQAAQFGGLRRPDFMLYSPGIGTLSYVLAVRFDEVEAVTSTI